MPKSESVIFCFFNQGKILCEWREYLGKVRPCILGGKVEENDRKNKNYLRSAVEREALEELGVTVESCDPIGFFDAEERRFHVFIVLNWKGPIGETNNDSGNKLTWIENQELISHIKLKPLKRLLQINIS